MTAAAAGSKGPAADRTLGAADGGRGPQRSAAAIPLPALVDALIAVRTPVSAGHPWKDISCCTMDISCCTRLIPGAMQMTVHVFRPHTHPSTPLPCNCIGLRRALSCFDGMQVGGVSEAALSIRRHAVTQMHNVIMQAVEAVEPAPQVICALHFSTPV